MIDFQPKFITFDCYGTLTNVQMTAMAREMYSDRLEGAELERFLAFFTAYRLDEVLGAWKPYRDVLVNAVERACKRVGVKFDEAEAETIYTAVPTWGPHPDVAAGLTRLATKYKLVILSNASDDQIHHNVAKLGAPFHSVFTAQQAKSFKPRMQGFEYMFEQLGCQPEDVFHVSASLRYDIMTADDLGIKHKAYVNRSSDSSTCNFTYYTVKDIGAVADLLGL